MYALVPRISYRTRPTKYGGRKTSVSPSLLFAILPAVNCYSLPLPAEVDIDYFAGNAPSLPIMMAIPKSGRCYTRDIRTVGKVHSPHVFVLEATSNTQPPYTTHLNNLQTQIEGFTAQPPKPLNRLTPKNPPQKNFYL